MSWICALRAIALLGELIRRDPCLNGCAIRIVLACRQAQSVVDGGEFRASFSPPRGSPNLYSVKCGP